MYPECVKGGKLELTGPPTSSALTIPDFVIFDAESGRRDVAKSNLTTADLSKITLVRSGRANLEVTSRIAKNDMASYAGNNTQEQR